MFVVRLPKNMNAFGECSPNAFQEDWCLNPRCARKASGRILRRARVYQPASSSLILRRSIRDVARALSWISWKWWDSFCKPTFEMEAEKCTDDNPPYWPLHLRWSNLSNQGVSCGRLVCHICQVLSRTSLDCDMTFDNAIFHDTSSWHLDKWGCKLCQHLTNDRDMTDDGEIFVCHNTRASGTFQGRQQVERIPERSGCIMYYVLIKVINSNLGTCRLQPS